VARFRGLEAAACAALRFDMNSVSPGLCVSLSEFRELKEDGESGAWVLPCESCG
jgi:hypothetical protein